MKLHIARLCQQIYCTSNKIMSRLKMACRISEICISIKVYPWASNPCGGGVEYLHRDPASRKRRRNGTKKAAP
jgi:hypothetical protein